MKRYLYLEQAAAPTRQRTWPLPHTAYTWPASEPEVTVELPVLDYIPDGACCICLGDFCADEKICELSCKHVFHTECIQPWCAGARKLHCPLCRAPVKLEKSADILWC